MSARGISQRRGLQRRATPRGHSTNGSRLGVLKRCPFCRRRGASVSRGGFSRSPCGSSVRTFQMRCPCYLYGVWKKKKNNQHLLGACSEPGREARPFPEECWEGEMPAPSLSVEGTVAGERGAGSREQT